MMLSRMSSKMHSCGVIMIAGASVLLLALFFLAFDNAHAQTTEDKAVIEDVNATVSGGYHNLNPKGNRSKVGEYEVLDSGAESSFDISGHRDKNYFFMRGQVLDENDQTYNANIDLNRYLRSDFSYIRFQHFLEHDQLTNQDYVQDFNKGDDNKLIIEELKAKNTILFPQLPFIKFNFDYRSYQKHGHRQATTVGKCSQCHVTSRNKRVDMSTNDATAGMEATLGPATIAYSHLLRDFNEHAAAPMADYGNGASFFLVQGSAPYSRLPDSRMNVDTVSLRSALPWSSTIFANVQHGRRENRDTGNDVTFNSFATRLSKYFSKFIACDAYFNKYKLENKSSGGIDRETKRGGFDVTTHPLKNSGLVCSYQWEDTSRNNADPNSTRKNIYRISWNQRFLKILRFNMHYKKTLVDDPFVMRDSTFSGLVQTSLPQKEDELYGSLSWSPLYNLTLNTSLRFTNLHSSRYDSDEDRCEYVFSFWYAPFERLTLSGAYTVSTTDVNSFGALKTYHLRGPESLFKYDDFPYDGRTQSWHLSATYLLTPRVSVTGDVSWIDSIGDFDKRVDGRNIGGFSDLSIGQVETSLGITYACTTRLTMYSKYMYREYNDHETSYYDGQINMISVGARWSF